MRTPSIFLALVLSGLATAQSATREGRPMALTATLNAGEACPVTDGDGAGLDGVPNRSGHSGQLTLDWCLDLGKTRSLLQSRKRVLASVTSRVLRAIERLTETIDAL